MSFHLNLLCALILPVLTASSSGEHLDSVRTADLNTLCEAMLKWHHCAVAYIESKGNSALSSVSAVMLEVGGTFCACFPRVSMQPELCTSNGNVKRCTVKYDGVVCTIKMILS